MAAPVCTVIAGPNGAGKTTFALTYDDAQYQRLAEGDRS